MALAEPIAWKTYGSGRWSDPANWDLNRVPIEGDAVTIGTVNGKAPTILLEAATPRLASLDSVAVLTFTNWTARIDAAAVTIRSGGTLTVARDFSETEMSNLVWVTCNTFDLQSGSSIDVGSGNPLEIRKALDRGLMANSLKRIAEPDCALRYGARWRSDLAPAADLLRDMPNAQALVAFLELPEIPHAGRFWWGETHYRNSISEAMAEGPVAVDFIGRDELLSGEIEKYKYIMYPMSRVVYKDHAAALRKAADAGVKIILDSYATNLYANCGSDVFCGQYISKSVARRKSSGLYNGHFL